MCNLAYNKYRLPCQFGLYGCFFLYLPIGFPKFDCIARHKRVLRLHEGNAKWLPEAYMDVGGEDF
jgi:hypothetical protein